MNRIFDDIKALMAFRGIDVVQLADILHKEPTSVKKQLNPKTANPQLSSLIPIAEALGGEIRIVTEESMSNDVEAFRSRIRELEDTLDLQRTKHEAEMEDLREQMKRRLRIMERMYESIESKDDSIKRLIAEKNDLTKKILELKGVEL